METLPEQLPRHDQFASHASKNSESLRADASDVARDLGTEELCSPEEIENLVDAMRTKLSAEGTWSHRHHQTRHLNQRSVIQTPSRPDVTRQRQWCRMVTDLDPDIQLRKGHLANRLPDMPGLRRTKKLMIRIRSRVLNERDLHKTAAALARQQSTVHKYVKPTTRICNTKYAYHPSTESAVPRVPRIQIYHMTLGDKYTTGESETNIPWDGQ